MSWKVATVGLGFALAAPEWVPSEWTREDGPIETATFLCFTVASLLTLVAASRLRSARPWQLAALGLGLVLLVAAGEEISWGQRLFDLDTPTVLIDGNRQNELNLHNVDGLQQKAVLAQLAIALAGVLLPRFVREPWARAGVPCFAGYLAYRAGRGVAAILGLDPAGDNAEAAELVLAVGFVALSWSAVSSLRQPTASARPATL